MLEVEDNNKNDEAEIYPGNVSSVVSDEAEDDFRSDDGNTIQKAEDSEEIETDTEETDELHGEGFPAPRRKIESERMDKLRSYYSKLGEVREIMQNELEATLAGTTVEGEVEEKLYEFSHSWRAIADEISKYDNVEGRRKNLADGEYHVGQNMFGMDFSGQDLSHADFSASNLQDANFKNATIIGADFTGADLSGADLSGANLTDSIFAGSKLKGTNFTGANMEGVILRDADIEDAILIDIRMDELAVEELQALVEYLAIYYPHKLNLTRINLSLLDLSRIDLSQVNLKGVDFRGVDFTGVNIADLDLSECIITPQQIAQAIGHMPTPEELKKILAPKKRKKAKRFYIDFSEFLRNGHFTGTTDLTKTSISTSQIVKAFLKIKSIIAKKPEDTDEVIFQKAQEFHKDRLEEERRAHNEEQRKNIEERKQKMLEETQAEKVVEQKEQSEKYVPLQIDRSRDY